MPIIPRPNFQAPVAGASAQELASMLRDGLYGAEAVEAACGIPAARIHQIAQGITNVSEEEANKLLSLAQEAELVARMNSLSPKGEKNVEILPTLVAHPGFRAPSGTSSQTLANLLRDSLGSAELVSFQTDIPVARIHQIAQGVVDVNEEEAYRLEKLAQRLEDISRREDPEFDSLAARFYADDEPGIDP